MILASGDPLNFILACLWTGAILLAWYAYIRWKLNPGDSLSHRIAVWAKGQGALVGFACGLVLGIAIGVVLGIFTGHWFWPVELG